MKAVVIGMLVASPPMAAWLLRAAEPNPQPTEPQLVTSHESPNSVQMPVEIVAKGSASEWVYVEVTNEAVPEPGVPALLALTSLLLLRRQRPGGK